MIVRYNLGEIIRKSIIYWQRNMYKIQCLNANCYVQNWSPWTPSIGYQLSARGYEQITWNWKK